MSDKGPDPCEKFYVYRSLHSDESWGAVILDSSLSKLPNIAFGMRVYAINEAAAITNAKQIYEKMHRYDSDKRNIREFASGAIRNFKNCSPYIAARKTMEYSVELNRLYKKYFEELEENNE